MAGYSLKGKTKSGSLVDIPLAATFDDDGNEIKSHYVKKTEYTSKIDEITSEYIGTFSISSWNGSSSPYFINIEAGTHQRGSKARIIEFNEGNGDEFLWTHDRVGNITVYSTVKVPLTVVIK